MADEKGGDRSRNKEEIREELSRLEARRAKLLGRRLWTPCDRGETAFQVRRIDDRMTELKRLLNE